MCVYVIKFSCEILGHENIWIHSIRSNVAYCWRLLCLLMIRAMATVTLFFSFHASSCAMKSVCSVKMVWNFKMIRFEIRNSCILSLSHTQNRVSIYFYCKSKWVWDEKFNIWQSKKCCAPKVLVCNENWILHFEWIAFFSALGHLQLNLIVNSS